MLARAPLTHPEIQYLDLLSRAWHEGSPRRDRTGVGTRALFGTTLRFDLSDGTVPLLTTKRVSWKTVAREMLWMLSGETSIRPLVAQGVHIWTDWPLARHNRETGKTLTEAEFEARILADDAFAQAWGDLGPVYGAQWRHWPRFEAIGDGTWRRDPAGIDQLGQLVRDLQDRPASRRLLFTGWNVAELDQMALPPCHMTYQYFVAEGRLSGLLHQRSCDIGLGLPYNLMGAALLLRMLAQQCDLEPGDLVWMGGDTHVYETHGDLVATQASREPRPWPTLRLLRRPDSLFDYRVEDFAIQGYDPHPAIPAPVAV